jgi:hypothetical protein
LALRRLKHLAILREIDQPAQKIFVARFGSGEHRLPACSFRQLAEKLFEFTMLKQFVTSPGVVGKLPTTAG